MVKYEVELEFKKAEKFTVPAIDSAEAEDRALEQFKEVYPHINIATVEIVSVNEIDG